MKLTKASILLLSCLAVLCLISGCSSKEPDFIGYVYHKDKENKTTLVLGIAFDKRSTALIRSGVTSLEVGTKVEVYYQTHELNSPFYASCSSSTCRDQELARGNSDAADFICMDERE